MADSTGTPLIKASTNITELGAASATHMIAAAYFFDPHSACRALFVLRAFHKLLEGLVEQVWITVSLKFFTRLFLVSIRFAIQTVFFFAFETLKIFTISFLIVNKGIIAVWSRTP